MFEHHTPFEEQESPAHWRDRAAWLAELGQSEQNVLVDEDGREFVYQLFGNYRTKMWLPGTIAHQHA